VVIGDDGRNVDISVKFVVLQSVGQLKFAAIGMVTVFVVQMGHVPVVVDGTSPHSVTW
jgi:hypothetical protein